MHLTASHLSIRSSHVVASHTSLGRLQVAQFFTFMKDRKGFVTRARLHEWLDTNYVSVSSQRWHVRDMQLSEPVWMCVRASAQASFWLACLFLCLLLCCKASVPCFCRCRYEICWPFPTCFQPVGNVSTSARKLSLIAESKNFRFNCLSTKWQSSWTS